MNRWQLHHKPMMIKSCWAFIFALTLIPLDAERALAQFFSSTIERNIKPWSLSPTDEIKVAQVSPKSEGSVVEHNTSSLHWGTGFPSIFLQKREFPANGPRSGPFTFSPTLNTT
jgi:hypothetical protein